MAQIRPFPSSRPAPSRARDVASVPYDVIDTNEARSLSAGNPASFLHVCRPEIDLPEGTSLYAEAVYAKGRENLDRFESDGTLVPDPTPRLLVYRQTWRGASQDGLVAACSVDDYDADVIKKHEKTRKDKEDDRTKHLLVQAAHAEPVFLTYRATDAVDARVASVTAGAPEIDFEAEDGVRHVLWVVPEADAAFFVEAFAAIPVLYVADGHHRSKSASRSCEALLEKGPVGPDHPVRWFPAAIFPDRQLRILSYNRLVKDLLGRTPGEFLAEVGKAFHVSDAGSAEPSSKGDVRMLLGGRWHALAPREPVPADDPIRSLDVSILQERLLDPILGIRDPRTDKRIDFVGGIRGTAELERRVGSGEHAVAFSMYPTTIAELMAIADAGETMPPKSTWFEPKLRSGLFVHRF
jgi:uncharacterized protein (DUF1015 family)